jgi:CRISPR/Cas system-associated endonuclease Cas1
MGLDPSLRLMHVDVRYRGGLAIDLLEPTRPLADELVLDLLQEQDLQRADVLETPRGVCRVGRQLARELAAHRPELRRRLHPMQSVSPVSCSELRTTRRRLRGGDREALARAATRKGQT